MPREDNDQERWNVAEELDVDGGNLAEQPVCRKTGNTDQSAQKNSQRDAHDENQKGVFDTCKERVLDRRVGVERVISD